MEYGKTSASRIEAQGKSVVAVWALNKISDSSGNRLEVAYFEDNTRGEFYPVRIEYSGAPGGAAKNKVEFEYEARPDVSTGYQAGSAYRSSVRLSRVRTFVADPANPGWIKEYRLSYELGPVTRRSRLTRVEECTPSSGCLSATMTYRAAPTPQFVQPDVWTATYGAGWEHPQHYSTLQYIDINGDGFADVCGRASGGLYCSLNQGGSSFAAATFWTSDYGAGWEADKHYSTIQYVDLNGDGLPDVCGSANQGLYCALNASGTRFNAATIWTSAYGAAGGWGDAPHHYTTIRFVDLNGDGLPDVCGRGAGGLYCALNVGGQEFAAPTYWSTGYSNAQRWDDSASHYSTIQYLDLNGDGLPDVCGRATEGLYCALNLNGTTFGVPKIWTPVFGDAGGWGDSPQHYGTIKYADLNADGLPDVCGRSTTGLYCVLNLGNESFGQGRYWTSYFANADGWYAPEHYSTIQFVDLNGDELPDVCGRTNGGLYCLTNSYGQAFDSGRLWTTAYGAGGWGEQEHHYATIQYVDINADGFVDVCGRSSQGLYCGLSTATDDGAWVELRTIDTDLIVTYGSAALAPLYVKDAGADKAAFPYVDVSVPMPVVASVRKSNGLGGWIEEAYTYGGLKVHVGPSGRGSQGFRWMRAQDKQSGLVSTTFFSQAWPYTGMALQAAQGTSTATPSNLSTTTNTLACFEPPVVNTNGFETQDGASCLVGPGKRYSPYVAASTTRSRDLNGVELPGLSTTNRRLDAFGNVGEVRSVVLRPDGTESGHGKTTTNVYVNDLPKWHLGRLLKSTVTSTAP